VEFDEILRMKEQIERTQRELEGPMRAAREHLELLESTGQLAKMQTATEAAQHFIDSIKPDPSTLAMIEASNLFVEKNRSILSAFEDNYAKFALSAIAYPTWEIPKSTAQLMADYEHTFTAGQEALERSRSLMDNVKLAGKSMSRVFDPMELKFTSSVVDAMKYVSTVLMPEYLESTGLRAFEEATRLNSTLLNSFVAPAWASTKLIDPFFERRLSGLSTSYAALFSDLAADPALLPNVPDFVVKLPPRDMTVKTEIIASRSVDYDPDQSAIDFTDPAYARSDVDLMLVDLDPRYVTILDEAFETVAGNTIGRVRHALNSLRELSMHVLHHLSPDSDVKKWNSDPKLYAPDGKPHRRLRVMYICRFIDHGAYSGYLNRTIAMHMALFDTLNELHAVRPDMSDFQLRLMLTDAITMLRFLLRTARYKT
jgi:Predicted pPIWI-associating nuclease